VEVDTFWSFVQKSAQMLGTPDVSGGVGPHWGCLSQDRPSRFVVAWSFACSENEAAPEVVARHDPARLLPFSSLFHTAFLFPISYRPLTKR
jgi:hypothetical protein